MSLITVSHLNKHFQIHKKEPGLVGSIKGLFHRQYNLVKAVNDITFFIDQAELIGFIGPNGAGKTTTLKCLSGLLYPTSGKVEVLGFNPTDRKPAFLKQIALVMGQKNQLWWDLPPMETFLLNKAIYEIPETKFKKTLNTLIDLLDVKDILDIQVRKLSLGQRMKCELIAALLHNPKVLFLDEPTIGLDVVMQKTMRDFIKNYNQEFASTIILTSHYMEDVKELAKRVIIIDEGRILFDGQLQTIIDKYARNKIITIVLSHPVTKTQLQPIAPISSFHPTKIRFIVPRDQAARKASLMLEKLPVADLTIEEPPIEAIIRDAFTGKLIQVNE